MIPTLFFTLPIGALSNARCDCDRRKSRHHLRWCCSCNRNVLLRSAFSTLTSRSTSHARHHPCDFAQCFCFHSRLSYNLAANRSDSLVLAFLVSPRPQAKQMRHRMSRPVRVRGYNDSLFEDSAATDIGRSDARSRRRAAPTGEIACESPRNLRPIMVEASTLTEIDDSDI